MSTAAIRSIVEDKVVAYLTANFTPSIAIHKGITDEIRTIPIIIAHAANATKPGSLGADNLGNFIVSLNVYIYTSADDETLESHRGRVSQVMGLLTDRAAMKTYWGDPNTQGKLYDIFFQSDSEGMANRKYGSVLNFTLITVLPPQV